MNAKITELQLNLLLSYIFDKYESFGPKAGSRSPIFSKLQNPSDLYTGPQKNTVIPFKKYLFPNGCAASKEQNDAKVAFLGLFNCDAWALQYFLEEFEKTNFLPKRENIFVITKECYADDFCFCDQMGLNHPAPTDLFVQTEKTGYSVFAVSPRAKTILEKLGIKGQKKSAEMRLPEYSREKFDQKKLTQAIENKEKFSDFWKGISDNCFGCGACTAVCPLCFCSRQDFVNNVDGQDEQCLNWDSCFAKRFSEVQRNFDLRPENADRLYNWYHHKFVRAPKEHGRPLCTGCGRCIEACPANLNINGIVKSLIEQDGKKDEK